MPSTHRGIEDQQFNNCSMSAVGRGSFPVLAGQVGNSSIGGRRKGLLFADQPRGLPNLERREHRREQGQLGISMVTLANCTSS